jgi:hypothetical protein
VVSHLTETRCPECGADFDRKELEGDALRAQDHARRFPFAVVMVPIGSLILAGICLASFNSGNWNAIGLLMMLLPLAGAASLIMAALLALPTVRWFRVRVCREELTRIRWPALLAAGGVLFIAQVVPIIIGLLIMSAFITVPDGP